VHHIALRTENELAQRAWQATIRKKGFNVTEVRDRKYFRSIYFYAPGGILFEIATDPPGFSVDEPLSQLGAALKLPLHYEPMRTAIEERLPPLGRRPMQEQPGRKYI
jgi:glyoxalase family protein